MADKPEPFEGPDREAAKRSVEELAVTAGAGRGTGSGHRGCALGRRPRRGLCAAGGASQLAQTATRAHAVGRAARVGLASGRVDPAQHVRSDSLGAARDSRNGWGALMLGGVETRMNHTPLLSVLVDMVPVFRPDLLAWVNTGHLLSVLVG